MDVTVVVATYGDESWSDLAEQRAIPSAARQCDRVIHSHADTLHEARNNGLNRVETEWVCHLDADDELAPMYFDAMGMGTADLRVPSVRYITDGRPTRPAVPKVAGHLHRCKPACLTEGNWIVIGAVVRTELVRSVGGWRDWPWSEDWDLWLRCHLAGASIEAVRRAVYRAHVRADSRNRAPDHKFKLATQQAIAAANGVS